MKAEKKHIPECIGFIMDGNRRWAKSQGKETFEGHTKGYQVMKDMLTVVHKAGVSNMICYAFSTENWNRSEEEVGYLMSLLRDGLKTLKKELDEREQKINIHVVGVRERLPQDLQVAINELESCQVGDPELSAWIAISYGGRTEILEAVNKAVSLGEEVNEETFRELMWTADMPDPDLIIRTSGEQRLSNFLLWQAAYSELIFTDTLWPDFGEKEFQSMLEEYAGRQRRKGK